MFFFFVFSGTIARQSETLTFDNSVRKCYIGYVMAEYCSIL